MPSDKEPSQSLFSFFDLRRIVKNLSEAGEESSNWHWLRRKDSGWGPQTQKKESNVGGKEAALSSRVDALEACCSTSLSVVRTTAASVFPLDPEPVTTYNLLSAVPADSQPSTTSRRWAISPQLWHQIIDAPVRPGYPPESPRHEMSSPCSSAFQATNILGRPSTSDLHAQERLLQAVR
ncbi:UNVERIFIED_CONTAM: hypothetical protein FKN15_019533 [Acipenser sinensis]